MKPAQKTFFIILLALFILLYLFRLHQVPEYKIPEDSPVRLIGRVSQQPYLKASKHIINVGPVVMITNHFPGYFYGQKLEIISSFEKKVINPFQVQYFAYYPSIRPLEEGENLDKITSFRRILFHIRGYLENMVNRFFAEPQSSLLNGILLGAKKEIPQDFWQKLRKTGTLHIVVASGYNISVVAGFLVGALTWVVSRKRALIFALLGIVLYTLMVGAEPPAVRAAIMAGVAFTAQTLGRQEDALIAMIFAAGIMLLISPLILFDIGFQLSFTAMGGIILLEPILKRRRVFNLPVFGNDLATTLAAQAGVMPIILANFGTLSFLSPLINTLVLPVVPLIMNLGGIAVFLGLFFQPLGQILSWFVWVLLAYFLAVISLFSHLPWIAWDISPLSFWWGIGYYFVLGIVIFRYTNKRRSPSIVLAKIRNEKD